MQEQQLNILSFQSFLTHYYEVEQYIALKNDNLEKFSNKWGKMSKLFD